MAASSQDSGTPYNPLHNLSAGTLLPSLLAKLGLQDGDLAASAAHPGEELWPHTAPDVFAWGPDHEKPDHDAPQLPGVPLKGVNLEDIHLVPVTGTGKEDGARLPYINVRARCAPQGRMLKDKSPWG